MVYQLPSLVLRMVGECLMDDDLLGTMASFSETCTTVCDAVRPLLWEECEWDEDYDWVSVFTGKCKMLPYIRCIDLETERWSNKEKGSWRLLSKCPLLEDLSIASISAPLLPPSNLVFPNLKFLELSDLGLTDDTRDLRAKESRYSSPYPHADPSKSFPVLQELNIINSSDMIHYYLEQIYLRRGEAPSSSIFAGVDGRKARSFDTVHTVSMTVHQQYSSMPHHTLSALFPNVRKLDLYVCAYQTLPSSQRVHLLCTAGVPSLYLESLEEVEIRGDMYIRNRRGREADHGDNQIFLDLTRPRDPPWVGWEHERVKSNNITSIVAGLRRAAENLTKATLQWPEWVPDPSGVDYEDYVKRRFTMSVRDEREEGEPNVQWEESRKGYYEDELSDDEEEEQTWTKMEQPEWVLPWDNGSEDEWEQWPAHGDQ